MSLITDQSTTLIMQTDWQETSIRPSRSAASKHIEIHKITCDGSGDASIYTKMDKPVAIFFGCADGATASATLPAADLDGATEDATTGVLTIAVKGTASLIYTALLVGYFEGE